MKHLEYWRLLLFIGIVIIGSSAMFAVVGIGSITVACLIVGLSLMTLAAAVSLFSSIQRTADEQITAHVVRDTTEDEKERTKKA